MGIFRNSRYTDSYIYADYRDRDIVFLDPIQEPRFNPSQDDLILEVVMGDRIDLIAERFYGDPALDWVILENNPNLDKPFGISAGDILRIPLPEKVRDLLA